MAVQNTELNNAYFHVKKVKKKISYFYQHIRGDCFFQNILTKRCLFLGLETNYLCKIPNTN